MSTVILYTSFEEFMKSYMLTGKVLYATEDLKGGKGVTRKIKLYFTEYNFVHSFSNKVCTGNTVVVDKENSCVWIEGDHMHGEDKKLKASNSEWLESHTSQLQDILKKSNLLWEQVNKLIDKFNEHIIFVHSIS